MKPDTYPTEKALAECDAVIHTVGALLEGAEYKGLVNSNVCEKLKNPQELFKSVYNTAVTASTGENVPYDETLEAKNRDACKLMAEHYNTACKLS